MNRVSFTSNRYSVNTTAHTFQNLQNDTTAKAVGAKRFSYQDAKHHQSTHHKENINNNATLVHAHHCLNHTQQIATYSALENTTDPMYLCERCAIMVASKGFEIAKIV